ncbi:hypothetical protein RP20_CCG018198 [Aedes albopictus]|nr:hypothetical protein RP20_CCG018198 [Aedes albopictus]
MLIRYRQIRTYRKNKPSEIISQQKPDVFLATSFCVSPVLIPKMHGVIGCILSGHTAAADSQHPVHHYFPRLEEKHLGPISFVILKGGDVVNEHPTLGECPLWKRHRQGSSHHDDGWTTTAAADDDDDEREQQQQNAIICNSSQMLPARALRDTFNM